MAEPGLLESIGQGYKSGAEELLRLLRSFGTPSSAPPSESGSRILPSGMPLGRPWREIDPFEQSGVPPAPLRLLPGEVESSEFLDPADIATFFTGAPLAAAGIKGTAKGLLSAIRSFIGRKGGEGAFDPTRRSLMKAGLGVAGAASSIGSEATGAVGTILTGASKSALGKMPASDLDAPWLSDSIKEILSDITRAGYKVLDASQQSPNSGIGIIVDVVGEGGKVARIPLYSIYHREHRGVIYNTLKSIIEPSKNPVEQSVGDVFDMVKNNIASAFKHAGFDPKVLDYKDKSLVREAISYAAHDASPGWWGLGKEHAVALLKGETSPEYLRGMLRSLEKESNRRSVIHLIKSSIGKGVPDHISDRIASEMVDSGIPHYWVEGHELIAEKLTKYSKEGGYDPTHIVARLLQRSKDPILSMSQGGEKVYKGVPTVGRSIMSNPLYQLNPREFMTNFWDDLLAGLEQKSPGITKDIYQASLPRKLRDKSVLQRNIEDVRSIADLPKLPEKLGKKLERKIRGIPKKIEKEIVDALGGANTEKEITDVLDIINKGTIE